MPSVGADIVRDYDSGAGRGNRGVSGPMLSACSVISAMAIKYVIPPGRSIFLVCELDAAQSVINDKKRNALCRVNNIVLDNHWFVSGRCARSGFPRMPPIPRTQKEAGVLN